MLIFIYFLDCFWIAKDIISSGLINRFKYAVAKKVFMALIAGVDEAGRGPLIGPMVMAGVVIDKNDEAVLQQMGVKDSKKIAPAKRELIFDRIKEVAKDIKVIIVEPAVIDYYVESEHKNLNWLEADKTMDILNSIDAEMAFIDCPSNNIASYTNYLRTKLKVRMQLKVEHKADDKYLVAGAASIIAKVTRDREIEKIKKDVGEDFGSGYPSDPITREFFQKNWNKHDKIFRHSWATYKAKQKSISQSSLGNF
ncbi:ribonuclease HII [Candidatus Woesearchaeota archaeon]|nr:ribonuclease HII [Candidatus Woesearchaeota archaeon]